ncbi:MAG: hypothetical protein KF819_06185 [Labilithrix sp.]|nr:hypothetical protein [Labilithrix sp.]
MASTNGNGATKTGEPQATAILRTKEAGDIKKAKTLLLSCMDLRVIDETAVLMHELGLQNKYDHVSVAGSSLGVLTASYKGAGARFEEKRGVADIRHFGKTFWNHVDLAIALHEIDKVVIVEHADCGAYKHFTKGATLHAPIKTRQPPEECRRPAPNATVELAQHRWFANELKRIIEATYANTYVAKGDAKAGLEVEIYLVTPWARIDRAAKVEAAKPPKKTAKAQPRA